MSNTIEHDHCPNQCEHPQPFKDEGGKSYCGCCFFMHGNVLVEMIKCTPETCMEMERR